MQDIQAWLDELGLGQYAQVFAENGVDTRALPQLGEQDLKDLGILLGHRRILLAASARFAEQETGQSTGSVTPGPSPNVEAERRHAEHVTWAKIISPFLMVVVTAVAAYLTVDRHAQSVKDREVLLKERESDANQAFKIMEKYISTLPDPDLRRFYMLSFIANTTDNQKLSSWADQQTAKNSKYIKDYEAANNSLSKRIFMQKRQRMELFDTVLSSFYYQQKRSSEQEKILSELRFEHNKISRLADQADNPVEQSRLVESKSQIEQRIKDITLEIAHSKDRQNQLNEEIGNLIKQLKVMNDFVNRPIAVGTK